MPIFNFVTAWVFHALLTGCLTVANIYGMYVFLKAYPQYDQWLGQHTGDWSLVLMFVIAWAIGRTISFLFVSRVILPRLDSNNTKEDS